MTQIFLDLISNYRKVDLSITHRFGDRRMQNNPLFLTAKQVKERYGGVSSTWLWRRSKDGADFPKPVKIHGRKFWEVKALEDFEKQLTSAD
jgi:predicted DNA-binding transcriptional regulator AlpA